MKRHKIQYVSVFVMQIKQLPSSLSSVFLRLANPYSNVGHHVSVKIPCHFNIPMSSPNNCVPVFKPYIRLVFYVYIYHMFSK